MKNKNDKNSPSTTNKSNRFHRLYEQATESQRKKKEQMLQHHTIVRLNQSYRKKVHRIDQNSMAPSVIGCISKPRKHSKEKRNGESRRFAWMYISTKVE